jgi:hypothetical protein
MLSQRQKDDSSFDIPLGYSGIDVRTILSWILNK